MQLVEFSGDVMTNPALIAQNKYKVLANIYNTIPGRTFTSSAYTKVSYHNHMPELNDEIKLRLPLVITKQHYILFTMHHVHVAKKDTRTSIGFFFNKADEDREAVTSLQCFGVLPLLQDEVCLVRDGLHRVEMCYGLDMETFVDEEEAKHMSDRTVSSERSTVISAPSLSHSKSTQRRTSLTKDKMPVIKIISRAFSTLLSSDKHVQHFLLHQPPRLGYYPTEMQSESPFYVEPLNAPAVNESILLDATRFFFDMTDANMGREEEGSVTITSMSRSEVGTPVGDDKKSYQGVMVEISRHFLVILRQLFRMMSGGIGKFNFDYANPFSHPILRCTAFISLVRVLGIVEPQNYEDATESVLQAYVEHLFDEEVFYHSMNRNTTKVSSRRRKSNARQELVSNMGNEEDAMLEHVVSQLEEVVYRGEILKAIKNAIVLTRTESIIETVEKSKAQVIDTHKPWYPTASSEDLSDVSVGERWWSGCIQKENLLTEITNAMTSDRSAPLSEEKGSDLNPLLEPVVVEPLLPKYHKLEGYKLRKLRLMETISGMSAEEKEHPPLKWWPWLYEIIAYQWTSLLGALDDETVSAKDVILEEEEEGEEEESASSYPYNKDNTAFTFVGDSVYLKDLRGVLMDHGPVLLAIILKSLALRIKHEDKQTLVVLDEETMVVFENLIYRLLREINYKKNSLLPPRKLNLAIANFIRQLFALVVPIQVGRLLAYYLIQSRKLQKQTYTQSQKVPMEQVKNRLNFLQHIAASDYFVTLNFPLQIDSALSAYHSAPIMNTHDLVDTNNSSIRGVKHPPSHWLCHFIIHEIMVDYQIIEKHLQDYAVSILSDLVIRNSYDKMHQAQLMRHRVAAMYLPLMKMITQDAERLESLQKDAVDRREELIIMAYLLQDMPEYLLREEFRQMTTRKLKDHVLPIERFLLLLHLIIDTFELPLTKGAEEGDVRKVLCPTITCEGIASDESGTMTSKLTLSRAQLTSKSTNEALSALEALHSKKLNKFKKREKATSAHSWKATSKTQSQTLKKTLRNVHPTILLHASKLVNFEAISCVVKALTIVMEECPCILQDFKAIYYDSLLHPECMLIMTNVLEVILHGLYSNISDMSVCELLRLTRKYLQSFGFGIFLQGVGDSLQDWMRILLKFCNADYAAVRSAASDCFVQLLYYCYEAQGSLSAIRVPVLAVWSDVYFAILKRCSDEDNVTSGNYLLPLKLAFNHMTNSAAGYDRPAFTTLVSEFVTCSGDILSAHHSLHIKKISLVAFSWDGVQRSPEYRARSPSSAASADADHLLELVYRVASIYQSTPLIRSSLFWLENLAKLHDDFNNVSESAMVHWRIHELISAKLAQNSTEWCPRKPLVWGSSAENKTFVKALHVALQAPPARPWPNSDIAEKTMIDALTTAAEKFSLVQLVFLSERAYHRLLDIHRLSNHTEHMSVVYDKLSKLYKDTSSGSISFAMGSFYRVLYAGQGKWYLSVVIV